MYCRLSKANKYDRYCHHQDCEENPKFFHKTSKYGERKKMRIGTTIGIVQLGSQCAVYCRDCIDKVYKEFKLVFDSKLWPLS